jgi:hypothetical protein
MIGYFSAGRGNVAVNVLSLAVLVKFMLRNVKPSCYPKMPPQRGGTVSDHDDISRRGPNVLTPISPGLILLALNRSRLAHAHTLTRGFREARAMLWTQALEKTSALRAAGID